MAAAAVLRSSDLLATIVGYQEGLPEALAEVQWIADAIDLTPSVTSYRTIPTTGHLSTLPMRFAALPYLQRYPAATTKLSNHVLFVSPIKVDSALALHLSVVEGNMAIIEQWLRHKPALVTSGTLELAAASSQSAILRLLLARYPELVTAKMMDLVAMSGDLSLLRSLHEAGAICTTDAMDGAAMNGHLDVVVFLHEARFEGCTIIAPTAAVANGHAPIFRYLLEHCVGRVTPSLFYRVPHVEIKTHCVVGTSHLEAIVLASSKVFLSESALLPAVRSLAALETLHAIGYWPAMTTKVLHAAIASRDPAMIRFVLDHTALEAAPPQDTMSATTDAWFVFPALDVAATTHPALHDDGATMAVAAFYGDLDTMQRLHGSHLGHVTVQALEYAALNGHLHVVHWLSRFRNDGVTSDALALACAHGHLDVTRYLCEVCLVPVSQTALATAAHTGHRRLVRYLLLGNDQEDDADDATYDTNECIYDHLLGCFRSTYVRTRPVDAAASQGHLAILELLVDHGADVTTTTMDAAVTHGHADIVRYLVAEHGQGCTVHHLCTALQARRVDLASYMLSHMQIEADGDDLQRLFVCTARGGSVAFLRQLRTVVSAVARPRTQELMLVHAVLQRHMHMLMHLCEAHGFKWTPNVHDVATLLGRKKVLKYLETLGQAAAESVVTFGPVVGITGYETTVI
ncbi:hypothetical protein SPRG_11143 [Saprolegnia parasitica CBS 223.65]|uniref:Uncharacterized protein n=1 Tax=Saprolegnia parasitica (strain CBS 223.65) TaxID=695850 RepID=A0A067C9L8_SAPPC|nr:hypothetical protein SPRG_11143 [Saprolegnia parasitica CBS 223.65]KDO23211.1 hypothetical protein SPRG_11143 [Saprolegnia parasitica CBS 223.65]|eukprot:XP_012206011.1 hypothetical protein SPRG_11143 [Saprolegnia parasitica CBS 223.65]